MGICPAGLEPPTWVKYEETVVSREGGGGGDKKFNFDQNIFQQDSTNLSYFREQLITT